MSLLRPVMTRRVNPLWGLAGCIAALTVVYAVSTWPLGEYDLLWHIETGKILVETGSLEGNTQSTYGHVEPGWATTQWLAEVILYAVTLVAGDIGLGALRLLAYVTFAAALTASVILAARRSQPAAWTPPLAAAAVIVIAGLGIVGALGGGLRPLMLTMWTLPIAAYWTLRALKAGTWPRWWITGGVTLLAVQLHGNALFIPALLCAAAAATWISRPTLTSLKALAARTWPVIGASVIALTATPLGIAYFSHARNISAAASEVISEWGPAGFDGGIATLPTFALIGAWGIALALSEAPRAAKATELVIYIPVAVAPFLAYRFIVVSLCIAAVFAAYHLAQAPGARKPSSRQIQPWPIAYVLVSCGIAWAFFLATSVMQSANPSPYLGIETTPRVASALSALDDRRVFVDYNLGGYLSTMTPDNVKVSQDGRSDRYGAEALLSLKEITEGNFGWQRKFNEMYPGTTDVLINKVASGHFLAEGWVVRCEEPAPQFNPQKYTYVWMVRPDLAEATPGCAIGGRLDG